MTTNTKELLQLAARAAGIKGEWMRDTAFIQERYHFIIPYNNQGLMTGIEWNPATNSGDSRDLQVKLKISLEWHSDAWAARVFIEGDEKRGSENIWRTNADPNMAVLLVASELGKAMKEGV